jgi:hypothetical protein
MQHITLLHSLLYIEKGSGIGFPVIGTKCLGDRKEKGKSCNETIQGGDGEYTKRGQQRGSIHFEKRAKLII